MGKAKEEGAHRGHSGLVWAPYGEGLAPRSSRQAALGTDAQPDLSSTYWELGEDPGFPGHSWTLV